jgi:hypothetical protein
MTNWELLTYDDPAQREKWRRICNSFENIDIFYFPEYMRAFELHGDGKPYLFVYYKSSEDLVIYPFLKRSLRDLQQFDNLSVDLYDIISPYGYSGYLRKNNDIDMEKFYYYFREYCKENNIVSEFIRFHPILNNMRYAPKAIHIDKNNETILINLLNEEKEIWSNMSSRCRNAIKKAYKYNIKIVNDINFNEIDIFYTLYIDTMTRLNANKYYFFSKEWFHKFVSSLKDNLVLFHAYYKDTIITSAIFIYYKYCINYFLTGSLYEMRHLAANNLLLYEVSLWAKSMGMKYFHLGGGYHGEDSLYRFKESFSPYKAQYYVGRIIHHSKNYEYLYNLKIKTGMPFGNPNFFPVYRTPEEL